MRAEMDGDSKKCLICLVSLDASALIAQLYVFRLGLWRGPVRNMQLGAITV